MYCNSAMFTIYVLNVLFPSRRRIAWRELNSLLDHWFKSTKGTVRTRRTCLWHAHASIIYFNVYDPISEYNSSFLGHLQKACSSYLNATIQPRRRSYNSPSIFLMSKATVSYTELQNNRPIVVYSYQRCWFKTCRAWNA